MIEMNKKTNKRSFIRLLSMLTAVMLCFALAVQVFADAEETGAEEVTLSAEQLTAAWDTFAAELDEVQAAAHAQTITGLKAAAYVREDVLKAVQTGTRCITAGNAFQSKIDGLKLEIQNHAGLTDTQKQYFTETLDQEVGKIAFSVVDNLMEEGQQALADTTYLMSTAKMDAYLETLVELEVQANNLDTILDSAVLLPGIDARIAHLTVALSGDQQTGDKEELLVLKLGELVRRREDVNKSLEEFFGLDAQTQTLLGTEILKLDEDLESFGTVALMDVVRYADTIRGELETTKTTLEQTQKKLVIGYIALGIGVVGLLMVLAVAIFAIGKSRGEQVDLSILASREDVEAMSRQNGILKGQIDQMSLRLESMTREIEEGKAISVAAVEPDPVSVPEEVPEKEEVAAPVPALKPEEPILGSSQQVGNLTLNYQSVSPTNSYLTMDPNGKLILFTDNTVELVPGEMHMANNLNGWINNGTFYLYDPEIDGRVLDIQKDKMPDGYYDVSEIVCRATVKPGINGYYVLQSKGVLRMRKQ